jgi:putative ABC transport system permease protein
MAMTLVRLALRNLLRRPGRNLLALFGLAAAVAVLACLGAFARGYERALGTEVDRMGMQLMLVPLGCPYDAAARVLKGRSLDTSLPVSAVESARRDPDVAVAAPLLLASVAGKDRSRTDLWAGIDRSALELKPWWKTQRGSAWFQGADSVILGSVAAEIEDRAPGDRFYSPETGRTFRVAGVLAPSGTSDDSLFFVPLATAQQMFRSPGRATAIAIRLRDPERLAQASERLQKIRGAQIVTLTEMMGTFLNLLASVRALLWTVGVVALAVSVLGVFNTMLAAVIERTDELALLRAVGASRGELFTLIALESFCLSVCGGALGLLLEQVGGGLLERAAKSFVPMAPEGSLLWLSPDLVFLSLGAGVAAGVLASLYPAWRASSLPPALAFKAD